MFTRREWRGKNARPSAGWQEKTKTQQYVFDSIYTVIGTGNLARVRGNRDNRGLLSNNYIRLVYCSRYNLSPSEPFAVNHRLTITVPKRVRRKYLKLEKVTSTPSIKEQKVLLLSCTSCVQLRDSDRIFNIVYHEFCSPTKTVIIKYRKACTEQNYSICSGVTFIIRER